MVWHLGYVDNRHVVTVPRFGDAQKYTCAVEQLFSPRPPFDSVAAAQVHAEAWFEACILLGTLETSDVMRVVEHIREQKRGGK